MKLRSVWLVFLFMLCAAAARATTFNFNGSGVVPVCPLSGTVYTCNSGLPNSSDTDVIIIASGYTVQVNSSVSFTYNQSLQMSGSAQLLTKGNGDINIADMNPNNLKVSGGTFTAGGTFSAGNQAQSFIADISATNINIGSGSTTKIVGDLTASKTITLASNVSIVGDLTAPTVLVKASNSSVNGNIKASSSVTIESNNSINGNVSGGALTMNDGGVVINGKVTMTGDVSIGSSDTINGDLVARNVTTKASGDVINGNAAVNAIYLDWGASVTKTITCTGPGAALCSCVTKADANYHPTCGAPAASGAHHIQITHSGQGLTCQAQTVQLKACADATCSSTYNGGTTVTLSPNGGSVSFNGSGSGTVSQPTAGTATLSATSSAISNANTCVNSGANNTSCNMVFSDAGLQLSAPDHVSMSGATLTIQALKASAQNPGTCVPLVQGTVPVTFSCGYMNPSSAAQAGGLPVSVGGSGSANQITCGASKAINITFDNTGKATPSLSYADVGQMSISASYTSANLGASGNTNFTTSPDSFKIDAKSLVALPYVLKNGAFARASDAFQLTVSALNANKQVTPNFGRESSQENFVIAPSLSQPAGGAGISAMTKGAFNAIYNGVATSRSDSTGSWIFPETGTLTLDVKVANSSGYYMGKSVTGFNPVGKLDLRFVPHHFDSVILSSKNLMSCAAMSSYSNPCASAGATDYFVYSGQGFPLKVTAYKDSAGGVSQNYRDAVAQAIKLSAAAGANGAAAATVTDVSSSTKDSYAYTFNAGVGQLSSISLPGLKFLSELASQSGAAISPGAQTTVFVRATDADGATSQLGGIEPSITLVSGRTQTANAYGSANAALPVEVRAQYYYVASGSSTPVWIFNPLYGPVSPDSGYNVSLTSGSVLFDCSGSTLNCNQLKLQTNSPLSFKNGKGIIVVAAPLATGSAKLTLTTVIPYLPFTDPGRITFGTYRSGPVVYTREIYN
ncbi:DUF6701 domain-containing protein [Duganella callida]|uniref:DUF6701 domain-containing protein n=1 Tax=Duganella callida TaxID=2561932 RepID=A0A4Y9S3X7_9BURK|nr:DUF6701 domain-containing protein [Duganella callida]TFW16118.1 hypothetical protein E4L98_24565 [Duganella callida]